MAYSIKLLEGKLWEVEDTLIERLKTSRFEVKDMTSVSKTRTYKGGILELRIIRLKEAKPYCGNHGGPCLIERTPKRKSRCLEGVDWVEFNDLVNDILDSLGVSADVMSSACTIRRGRSRRVVYKADSRGEWDKLGTNSEYEDWSGRVAPRSKYPEGTPGGEE